MYIKAPLWEILALWSMAERDYEDSKDRHFQVSGRDSSQLLAVFSWKPAPGAEAMLIT